MAKASIKPKIGIASWDEANEKLKLLGEIQGQLDARKAGFEARIETLKAQMKRELDGYTGRMNALAQEIYMYALNNQDGLEGRSKKLLHGTVAFRKVSELKLPKDQQAAIALLKQMERKDLIRIKEEIDKPGLKREPDLAGKIGAKLVERDSFRIDLPEYTYDFDKKLKPVKK